MKNHCWDVIVIGGGIAGLYTAYQCLQQGWTVLLIEKTNECGGRIRTIYHPPLQWEAGAGRFHATHMRLRNLLQTFGLHEYRLTPSFSYNGHRNPASKWVNKVTSMADQMSEITLRNMTFQRLCVTALGEKTAKELQHAFGYDAEFQLVNAKDGVDMFRHDFHNRQYYGCKEGLSELVQRLQQTIHSMKGVIYKNTRVTNIQLHKDLISVSAIDENGRHRRYKGEHVVCALPKADLETLNMIQKKHQSLLDHVAPVPLHRIYGGFDEPWFSRIVPTTTHHAIRQFIPVDKKHGVAMVSYSDTHYADYWKRVADRGTKQLQKEVLKQLQVVFPNIPVPPTKWIESYYWPQGVHMWKTGIDSSESYSRIQHLLGDNAKFYVVGEAFCKHQGWIEGALESVDDVVSQFHKHSGGANPQQWLEQRKHILTKKDLVTLKHSFPNFLWVTLKHPQTGVITIVEVGEWMHRHPGGDVFTSRIHTDVSQAFYDVSFHKEWLSNNVIKQHVIDMVNKYTVAVVRT